MRSNVALAPTSATQRFDAGYSVHYTYTLCFETSVALFLSQSTSGSTYPDSRAVPACRLQQGFKKTSMVRFMRIGGNDSAWCGAGRRSTRSDGFPGYSEPGDAVMVSNHGKVFQARRLLTDGFPVVQHGDVVTMTFCFNAVTQMLAITAEKASDGAKTVTSLIGPGLVEGDDELFVMYSFSSGGVRIIDYECN